MKRLVLLFLCLALVFSLAACKPGPQGEQGIPGKDGEAPTISISDDGYWVINGVKTEHKAIGTDGKDGQDGEDGKDGQDGAPGQDGEDGKDGIDGTTPTIEISADGYWIINGVKTEHCVCDCDKCEHSYVTAYVLESTCALRKVLKECEICGYLTVLDEEPIIEHNCVDRVCTVCGEYILSEGLKFTLSSNKSSYKVSDIGTCTDLDILVPSTYNGLPVTSIGDDAFSNCYSLTSITIPDSVTWIGERAFAYCDSLTSITIPASVTSIGSYAFLECDSLTSITIPASVTSIGYGGAFENCDSLTSITVDENNQYYKSIDGNLYTKDDKTLLQYAIGKKDSSFTIPLGVTWIGNGAFAYCNSLTSITIPDSVTNIGYSAFFNCNSLTSITIPASVTSIDSSAFDYCYSLTSIAVDENNQYYKDIDGNLYTKDGKTLIQYAKGKKDTSFTIPSGVTSIGYSAFFNCNSLTSITISSGVTSIGSSAFAYCYSLTSITIPSGITSIGYEAFWTCDSLKTVYYTGTASEWDNISIGYFNQSLTTATRYYYSEAKPTVAGNYWHYVDGEIVVW